MSVSKQPINCSLVILALLLVFHGNARAEQANARTEQLDERVVKEALVLKAPSKYLRSMVPIDPVEVEIVTGKWAAPKKGSKVKFSENEVSVWESITADEEGWFENESLRGGYAYLSVDLKEPKTLILEGMGHDMVYVNGVPRAGNRYQYKEEWESWETRFDYSQIPVGLNEGRNDLLFYCSRSGKLKVKLYEPRLDVMLNIRDLTAPDLIVGEEVDVWGAAVVINASADPLEHCFISASYEENNPIVTPVPRVIPKTVRKIRFRIKGKAPFEGGSQDVELKLIRKTGGQEKLLDQANISLGKKYPNEPYKKTFLSEIDESVQYYAVNPAAGTWDKEPKALFLSVHGAAVEAIGQARAYNAKTWGHIVAPTNRRPYGFNWEDWGRLDAMEVLREVEKELNIDPDRIYLTGHSMGGHGAWHLGAIYPDRFAAIGPSAGWISFWLYRVREKLEDDTPMAKMLMRAALPSNTFTMAGNYEQLGVYIIHGSDDDNVPAEQSHMMVEHLDKFHKDFIYHEEKGAGHWWDITDEPGADCVDWPPLFDFFARHARPAKEMVRHVEFITANPGISSSCHWLGIEDQIERLEASSANVRFDPGKKRFVGSTENISRLSLEVTNAEPGDGISIELDGQQISDIPVPEHTKKIWVEKKENEWRVVKRPALSRKGPHRYGTFKDVFRNQFVFVFGTKGTKEENEWALAKARYDAEIFWYQGNGTVDIVADVDFDPKADRDNNVILYGNKKTNAAWKSLLSKSPVQVGKNSVTVGDHKIKGDDLGCLFIRPRPGSETASVGVVTGTGITGMRLTDRRPYLSPGYGFPDCMVFSLKMLSKGSQGVRAAGIFGGDWGVDSGEFVWND